MSERMMQFWVGLFALAAVVLFCVLLSWFGDLPNHFKEKRYVIATYRNAGGVGVGTPVYRSGIRVGEVLAIEFDSDQTADNPGDGVLVTIVLDDPRYLPRNNHRPQIGRGLLGDASIEFLNDDLIEDQSLMPTSSSPFDAPRIAGRLRPDPAQAIEVATETISKAQETLETIRKAADGIALLTGKLESAGEFVETWTQTGTKLGDIADEVKVLLDKNADQVGPTLANIRSASDRLNLLLDEENRAKVQRVLDRIDEAARGLSELQPLLVELGDTTNAPPRTQLGQTAYRLNRIASDLGLLTAALRTRDGRLDRTTTLAQLFTSSQTADNLNRMTLTITDLAANARIVLDKFSRFADKIAADPSALTRGALQRQ
ncbi:Mammalian cell entry related domain protein [Isosphaera pallida ATCC 43644]|uniref:Mammalian cell entry related domain protein n=1 Tax=Isosphaera pallida (strain ATCC 43644 / DSM 9630 / IS1B) TaxID=575540 RepID=E8R0Y9_ISOPI|nr:MlaD family protein [Isosphaera pallida]ADV62335.1 Mammalian cell entry related domain protein [Isosphaera pallida ATCC 43644]